MLKGLITLISRIVVMPLFLIWKIYYSYTGKETLFGTFSQMLSLFPGKIGVYIRRGFYRSALLECADDVDIGFGTFFPHPTVRIGKGVYIGSGCTIGMARIGDGVMIGSNVDILSGRRQHRRDQNDRILGSEEGIFEQIEIGSNTWIGNSAVVMANIGKRCTIGAGCVVVKDVSNGQTVVGNPAREIRESSIL